MPPLCRGLSHGWLWHVRLYHLRGEVVCCEGRVLVCGSTAKLIPFLMGFHSPRTEWLPATLTLSTRYYVNQTLYPSATQLHTWCLHSTTLIWHACLKTIAWSTYIILLSIILLHSVWKFIFWIFKRTIKEYILFATCTVYKWVHIYMCFNININKQSNYSVLKFLNLL